MIWHLPFAIHAASVTRKSCFLRFCETLRIDVASKRLMNESTLDSTHARSGSISLFPGFRLFSRLPRVLRYATQLYTVEGKREFLQGYRSDGFCFPRILKYWNYTIRRSNLIENKGATVIYDRSDICSRRVLIDLRHWSRSAVHTLKAKNPIVKSAYLYLTFSVARSIFFGKKNCTYMRVTGEYSAYYSILYFIGNSVVNFVETFYHKNNSIRSLNRLSHRPTLKYFITL